MTYEGMKSLVKKKIRPDPMTIELLICGGLAGTVAQTSELILLSFLSTIDHRPFSLVDKN
jgi:hypothetical protein